MRTRKTIVIIVTIVAVVLTASGLALADWINTVNDDEALIDADANIPTTVNDDEAAIDADADAGIPTEIPGYISIAGVIVSIEETDGGTLFIIEDEHGNPAHLFTNEDTEFVYHWLMRRGVAVGDTVTGWYESGIPIPMIWPAQYPVVRLDIQE